MRRVASTACTAAAWEGRKDAGGGCQTAGVTSALQVVYATRPFHTKRARRGPRRLWCGAWMHPCGAKPPILASGSTEQLGQAPAAQNRPASSSTKAFRCIRTSYFRRKQSRQAVSSCTPLWSFALQWHTIRHGLFVPFDAHSARSSHISRSPPRPHSVHPCRQQQSHQSQPPHEGSVCKVCHR